MINPLDLIFPPVCAGCGDLIPPHDRKRSIPMCGGCLAEWDAERRTAAPYSFVLGGEIPAICVTLYRKGSRSEDGQLRRDVGSRMILLCKNEDVASRFDFLSSELYSAILRAIYTDRDSEFDRDSMPFPGMKPFRPIAAALSEEMSQMIIGGEDTAELLIVPIPCSPEAKAKRGFDQALRLSQSLAALICRRGGKAKAVDALFRVGSRQQKELSAHNRRINADKAYRIKPKYRDYFSGRRVLLVDDVITTGSSMLSCAALLYAVGADEVAAAAFGRSSRKKVSRGRGDVGIVKRYRFL